MKDTIIVSSILYALCIMDGAYVSGFFASAALGFIYHTFKKAARL